MRILYVGTLASGTTSLQRKNAFERLGHNVVGIDSGLIIPRPVFINRCLLRLFRMGFPVKLITVGAFSLNRSIISEVKSGCFDVLWIDKGWSVNRATLKAVRGLAPEMRIVGYSPDVMSKRENQSQHFLEHLNLYDHYFTTKSFDLENLKALGMQSVSFVENGFDTTVHRPIRSDDPRFKGKVGFVGTYEAPREQSMLYLAEHGVSVTVFGGSSKGWSEAFRKHSNIEFVDTGLYGDEYAEALSNFAINLCFLKHWNGDLVTTRSIEIPACGGFMVAEKTEEHLALFEDGKEAVFFASDKELLDKVTYYLSHESERELISNKGHQKVVSTLEICSCLDECLSMLHLGN